MLYCMDQISIVVTLSVSSYCYHRSKGMRLCTTTARTIKTTTGQLLDADPNLEINPQTVLAETQNSEVTP